MADLIDRQIAIDAIKEIRSCIWEVDIPSPTVPEYIEHHKQMKKLMDRCDKLMINLVNSPIAQQWIPVMTRPMTEEERRCYTKYLGWDITDDEAVMFDCQMPEDGQEIWVCSKCGNIWKDTCIDDEGIGLEENGDWFDIVAWMPFEKPKPWKGKEDDE